MENEIDRIAVIEGQIAAISCAIRELIARHPGVPSAMSEAVQQSVREAAAGLPPVAAKAAFALAKSWEIRGSTDWLGL